jgi:hypothetical protein
MSEGQKELLMLAVCLSFFFVCGIFAESAIMTKIQMMTPAIPWILK